MKSDDLIRALGAQDPEILIDAAPRGKKRRQARTLRVLLVAAIVALLAGALTLTTFALSEKPEPTPVETETVDESNSEAFVPKKASVILEEQAFQIAEIIYKGVVYGGSVPYAAHKPYLIIQLTGISNEEPRVCDEYGNNIAIRVDCEVIYAQGLKMNLVTDQWEKISAAIADRETTYYLPEEVLKTVNIGDTILCYAKYASDYRTYGKLYCAAPMYTTDDYRYCLLIDGKLQNPDPILFGSYNDSTKTFINLLEKREKLKGYLNEVLLDSMPKTIIQDGSTVEEIIEVCEWYQNNHDAILEQNAVLNNRIYLAVKEFLDKIRSGEIEVLPPTTEQEAE